MQMIDALIALLYAAVGVSGWFIKDAVDTVKATKDNLANFKTEVAKEYVPRNDLRELQQEVGRRFDRLEEKLDRLVERSN